MESNLFRRCRGLRPRSFLTIHRQETVTVYVSLFKRLIVHIYEPASLEYDFRRQSLTCEILKQYIRIETRSIVCYKCKVCKFWTSEMFYHLIYTVNPFSCEHLTLLRNSAYVIRCVFFMFIHCLKIK